MQKRKLPIELINYCINSNTFSGTPTPPEVRTYATWNPADKGTITLSNNDLTEESFSNNASVRSTISKSSGKWYSEFTIFGTAGGGFWLGIANSSANVFSFPFNDAGAWIYYGSGNLSYHLGTPTSYGSGGNFVAGEIMGILLDMDAGTVSVNRNGVSQGVMYSGLTGSIFMLAGNSPGSGGCTANFGATPFAYSVPSGYNEGLYDTVDLSSGLVAHYPLATDSLDTSGNGYDGVDTNMSFDGTSAVFNGTNAFIAGLPNFLGIPEFSVSCWLSLDEITGVFRGVFETSANYTMVDYSGSGTVGVSTYSPSAGGYLQYIPNGVLVPATYYHVVLTYASGVETAYRNGTTVGSVGRSISTGYFIIGKSSYNDMYWKGKMKKFRIYNRVLNAGEIAALYAEG